MSDEREEARLANFYYNSLQFVLVLVAIANFLFIGFLLYESYQKSNSEIDSEIEKP